MITLTDKQLDHLVSNFIANNQHAGVRGGSIHYHCGSFKIVIADRTLSALIEANGKSSSLNIDSAKRFLERLSERLSDSDDEIIVVMLEADMHREHSALKEKRMSHWRYSAGKYTCAGKYT